MSNSEAMELIEKVQVARGKQGLLLAQLKASIALRSFLAGAGINFDSEKAIGVQVQANLYNLERGKAIIRQDQIIAEIPLLDFPRDLWPKNLIKDIEKENLKK